MPLSAEEMKKLHKACEKLPTGPDYRCDDYVFNVISTVIDFFMRSGAVDKACNNFLRKYKHLKTHEQLKALIAKYPDSEEGNHALSNALWNNNHWTRAEFLRQLLACFEKREIRDQESLKRWFTKADFEKDIHGQFKTEHHAMGFAIFHWLLLRLGVDTIKPDVRVHNFVLDAIGRQPSDEDIVNALVEIAHKLPKQHFKAFRLDAAIWHAMGTKTIEET
jgi:hypothetical protein